MFAFVSDCACMCLRDRNGPYFVSDHLLPVLYTYICVSVCVCVCACVYICVCSPVVTVLKSKLTSPSPCNSICPSARPLGDYRERERGRGIEKQGVRVREGKNRESRADDG